MAAPSTHKYASEGAKTCSWCSTVAFWILFEQLEMSADGVRLRYRQTDIDMNRSTASGTRHALPFIYKLRISDTPTHSSMHGAVESQPRSTWRLPKRQCRLFSLLIMFSLPQRHRLSCLVFVLRKKSNRSIGPSAVGENHKATNARHAKPAKEPAHPVPARWFYKRGASLFRLYSVLPATGGP